MAQQQSTGFCEHCNKQVMTTRPGVNHILHFLITFLTCGAWVIVWIGLCIKFGGWKCSSCGLPVSDHQTNAKKSPDIIIAQTNRKSSPGIIIVIFLFIFFAFLMVYPNYKTTREKAKTKVTKQQQIDVITKADTTKEEVTIKKEKTKLNVTKKKNIEKTEIKTNNIVDEIKRMQKEGLLSKIEPHLDIIYVDFHKWQKLTNDEKEENIRIIKTYCGATKYGYFEVRYKHSGKLISKHTTTRLKRKTIYKKKMLLNIVKAVNIVVALITIK